MNWLQVLLLVSLLYNHVVAPVDHIVTLMMENRSFDHYLGFLHLIDSRIDGLTGNEYNLEDTTNPSSKKVYVNKNGYDTGPDDPGHSWEDTAEQVWGKLIEPPGTGKALMDGFAQNALHIKHNAANPLSMFTNASAPILNTLATEFAIFDRWFAALPGPTDPNRSFFMSGTSNGAITNFNGTLWSQRSFFDVLRTSGISWRAYYQDDPWAMMYFSDMHSTVNSKFVSTLDKFLVDLSNGTLSQFTLLQPRMTSTHGPPTWQHPDASVAEGERLIKEIYEALRASPFWPSLAFLITFDEHGGFYDHVAPPQTGVPSPDEVKAHNGFTFDRLGIRIPTVLISPLIPKGTVVHEPTGPTPTSQYTATSLIATVKKMFNVTESVGKRVAWSGTFESIFSLDKMRDDCPLVLSEIPPYTQEAWDRQRSLPLNDHLQIQVQFYCEQNNLGKGCGEGLVNQGLASDFIVREAEVFMKRIQNQDSLV